MVFNTAYARFEYGNATWADKPGAYCQNNTSASDYGKCYGVWNKAVFVQSDTATYPVGSLPCELDNTCIRYTNNTYTRIITTVFSYSGKQGIMQYFWSRTNSPFTFRGNVVTNETNPVPIFPGTDPFYLWFLPARNYEVSSWPVYDPLNNFKAYVNPYTIPSGYVNIIRWSGIVFATTINIVVPEGNRNNIWYAFDVVVTWAYESSPLAVIPLDYDRDYVPYQELYSAFGFSINGVDQPGWNAEDVMNVLRELFPDRAWAVFDDRTKTLHLYNLTPDYVPDWLIGKLVPVSMKVVKAPANAAVAEAWMNELNRRNVKIPA